MKQGAWWRTVKLGVSSLLLHKLRSALTTMGVLFSCAASGDGVIKLRAMIIIINNLFIKIFFNC